MNAFICLLTAHAVGDFLLQSSADVRRKGSWHVLLKHGLIHASLSYLLLGSWRSWAFVAAVFIAHAAIDLAKTQLGSTRLGKARVFLIDQALHLVSLWAISEFAIEKTVRPFWLDVWGSSYLLALVLIGGFVLAVFGSGYLIDLAVEPYLEKLSQPADRKDGSVSPPKPRGLKAVAWQSAASSELSSSSSL